MMNLLSLLYMLAFAACGVLIARPVFKKDDALHRLFFGLVFGLMMLIWLPTLYAFLVDFTLLAQLLALGTAVLLAGVASFVSLRRLKREDFRRYGEGELKKQLVPFILTALPLLLVIFTLHLNHTIVTASNGSLHVGQCTYGDLCMHLGFISSISVQKTFPPMYSLLPGTPLGYPFLCDSVSSTFYTLGASLRTAALLPALYACVVVVLGVYLFFDAWFKNTRVTVLATLLFFIGGGFGFWYFFNNKQLLAAENIDRMEELMKGFYHMPTNMPAEGLRWVNAIADMLLPQRATLFGWALLFPGLQLLFRGAVEKENRVFIPLAFIAGSLPLVHTHSFLALGLISAFLFVAGAMDLLKKRSGTANGRLAANLCACFIALLCFGLLRKLPIRVAEEGFDSIATGVGALASVLAAFVLLAVAVIRALKRKETLAIPLAFAAEAAVFGAAAFFGIRKGSLLAVLAPLAGAALFAAAAFFAKRQDSPGEAENRSAALSAGRKNLLFFALFGVITLALAAPQLFGFTFRQSSNSDSFLRWNFNWDNVSDSWLWFYIKNLGLLFILIPPAFLFLKREHRLFYGGGLVIWAVCEMLLFQPNPYDDNKLLFVWFALTCGIVGNYIIGTLAKPAFVEKDGVRVRDNAKTAARCFVFICVLFALFTSGVMTLAREYVSADHYGTVEEADGSKHFGFAETGYEVTPSYMVELTDWIKANTEPDATFLTHNNHNNAVAMLTGRNIFCGSGTFLHWHGVNYKPRQQLIGDMYTAPDACLYEYAAEYDIDYVLISPEEVWNYTVDRNWFENNLECVYTGYGVSLYRIPQPEGDTLNGAQAEGQR